MLGKSNLNKENLLHKGKGESVVSGAAMLGLTIICMFVLLTLLINYFRTFHRVEEVNMIARTYLIKMELNNSLNQEDVDEMVEKLTEIGMTDIKISGNFASSVTSPAIKNNENEGSYATDIYIQIEGKLNTGPKTVKVLGVELDIGGPKVSIDVTKRGVAVR